MESASQVSVPLRSGGKKMRKRRELDALVAHSLAKRANKKNNNNNNNNVGNGINSQDQLLSPSTDEQEDFGWPKIVHSSSRARNRKFSFLRMCGPLIFVTCITLSLGFMYWLYFDLRQQLYEYRQKIEEVSVTSQNLPEALQKWHETSKSLEQNQTIIYGKIQDLQHSLENLNTDLQQYKTKLNEKKDFSQEEKLVANFGAKIEAVSVDVEGMKDKFGELLKEQGHFNDQLKEIKENITSIVLNATSNRQNDTIESCTAEIENIRKVIFEQNKYLNSNLSIVNETFSQKSKGWDDELILHKKTLETLSENVTSTTSHVTSIENDWIQFKPKAMDLYNFNTQLKNVTSYLENAINEVRNECNKIHREMQEDITKAFKQNKIEKKDQLISPNSDIGMKSENENGNTLKSVTTVPVLIEHTDSKPVAIPAELVEPIPMDNKNVSNSSTIRPKTDGLGDEKQLSVTDSSVENVKPKLLSIPATKTV